MAIRKEGQSMSNYKIARRLDLNPSQTNKRLKILSRNRVLQEIEGYPKFYTFNSNNHNQDFVIQTVECPKCKKLHIIHHSQITVQCICKTRAGKLSRFYIYDKRIINKKILTKQTEQTIGNGVNEVQDAVTDMITHSQP